MWDNIAKQISDVTGEKFPLGDRRSVGGGCINQGYRVTGGNHTYFVKLNRAVDLPMFEAEALGLQQMRDTHTIRVPQPICTGISDDSAYIVLEWMELASRADTQAFREMGRKLAALHQYSGSDQFGWSRNNTIGSTPQINTWTPDWTEFWAQHRIGFQLQLARRKGGHFPEGDRLIDAIPKLLAGHTPQPSLVHGDLWGGNAAVTQSGEPILYDPATYYGDREVDLAMTELFGGFSSAFYQGYNEVWPLSPGYEQRKTLYNLYHILNHFNLFGGGYGSQANRAIATLLH
jgi:fructosamine-3-kinase